MMLTMASLMVATAAVACAVMGAILGVTTNQAATRWGWITAITVFAATSGAFGGFLAYAITTVFPGIGDNHVRVADVLTPVIIIVLVGLICWGTTRLRQRRLCTIARQLDHSARAIWYNVADDVASWHAAQGTEDWVHRHFKAVEDALARHRGDAAVANLRHATVRLAIALRPAVRANPTSRRLSDALTAALAVRDRAISAAKESRVDLSAA